MACLSGFNILIIDYPEAYQLRTSLILSGAVVHVVSPRGALMLARQRRIDAAFVGFGVDAETRALCEQLTELGVGQIIVTPGNVDADHRQMLPELVRSASRRGQGNQTDPTLH